MGIKTCKKCGVSKDLSNFYTHPKMSDGHLNFCKPCVVNRVKLHRKENDSVRQYDVWRYQNHKGRKEAIGENVKKYRKKSPEKYKAHTALNNAVRDGRLTKHPCSICGSEKSHGHHDDYSKPLEVTWLCALHHHRLHHAGD